MGLLPLGRQQANHIPRADGGFIHDLIFPARGAEQIGHHRFVQFGAQFEWRFLFSS
jgi:hypothetical protein